MLGEDVEERIFERPLAPVIVQYVLIVSQIFRQLLVLHQSSLESLPLLLRLRLLCLLLSFQAGSVWTPCAFSANDTHRRCCRFPWDFILRRKIYRIWTLQQICEVQVPRGPDRSFPSTSEPFLFIVYTQRGLVCEPIK